VLSVEPDGDDLVVKLERDETILALTLSPLYPDDFAAFDDAAAQDVATRSPEAAPGRQTVASAAAMRDEPTPPAAASHPFSAIEVGVRLPDGTQIPIAAIAYDGKTCDAAVAYGFDFAAARVVGWVQCVAQGSATVPELLERIAEQGAQAAETFSAPAKLSAPTARAAAIDRLVASLVAAKLPA